MADATFYELLGLQPSATADEIRSAFIRLSQRVHPDHDGSGALFRQVKLAYETLSNPARREAYDQSGYVDQETQSSNASAPGWRRTDDKPPKGPGPKAKPKADPTSSSHDESSDEPPPPRSPPPPPPPARDQSTAHSDGETDATSSALRRRVAANPSWALLGAGVLMLAVGGRNPDFLFLGLGAVVVGFVGVLGRKKAAHFDHGPVRTGGGLLADELKAGVPTAFKGALVVFLGVLAAVAAGSKSGRKRKRRR